MSYYARIRIRPDWCIALRLIALSELRRQNELFLEENNFLSNMGRGMNDIVERLREGCIYYERNKLFVVDDDATDNLLSEAADLIECQREALRVAREGRMSDIVKRLRREPYWVGGSQQQSEGDSNSAPFDAADLIERQREALLVAREALTPLERMRAYWMPGKHELEDDPFPAYGLRVQDIRQACAALAAIDAALKEDGE